MENIEIEEIDRKIVDLSRLGGFDLRQLKANLLLTSERDVRRVGNRVQLLIKSGALRTDAKAKRNKVYRLVRPGVFEKDVLRRNAMRPPSGGLTPRDVKGSARRFSAIQTRLGELEQQVKEIHEWVHALYSEWFAVARPRARPRGRR